MKNTLLRHMRHLLLIGISTLSLAAGLAGLTAEHAHAATLSPAIPSSFQFVAFEPDPTNQAGGITLQWDPDSQQVRAIGRNFSGGDLTLTITQRQYFAWGLVYNDTTLTTQVSPATDFATDPVPAQDAEVQVCGTYSGGGANDGSILCTDFYTNGSFTEQQSTQNAF